MDDLPIAGQEKPKPAGVGVFGTNVIFATDRYSGIRDFIGIQVDIATDYFHLTKEILSDNDFWMSGDWVLYLALLFSIIAEILPRSPQYNTCILLVLMEAKGFFSNMLPQFIFFLVFIGSFILDIVYWGSKPTDLGAKGLTALVFIGKIFAIFLFLEDPRAAQVKKYLIRRGLVFCPSNQTYFKRINRDMRSRIIAIAIIHAIGFILYAATFLMAISTLNNVANISNLTSSNIVIWEFLIVKAISTAVVLIAILLNADITLSLAHFGIFGCYMNYIRQYIKNCEKNLKEFPLFYRLDENRYNILCGIKVLDFIWGIVGWASLNNLLGSNFNSARTDVQGFISVIVFALIITDIWGSILMVYLRTLFSTRAIRVSAANEGYDSDDSEIYELRLRSFREAGSSPAKDRAGKRPWLSPVKVQPADVEGNGGPDRGKDDDDDDEEEEDEAEGSYDDDDDNEAAVAPAPNKRRSFLASVEEGDESVGTTKEQFTTTRRSSGEVQAFASPGNKSQDNSAPQMSNPAAGNTGVRQSYDRGRESFDGSASRLVLDTSSSIDSKLFSTEWNSIDEAQELNCGFKLPPHINTDKVKSSDINPFIKYLRSLGLNIIAAGEVVNKASKVYAYAVGRPRAARRASIESIHFLLEINLTLTTKARSPFCSLDCLIKCTDSSFTFDFLTELQLERKLNSFKF